MNKPYLPLDEILEIFQINLATAKSVLKKHKVDTFSNKGKIMIHAKDFYKAYTRNFNPSLFEFVETKQTVENKPNLRNTSEIFQKLFGSSYEVKKQKKPQDESLWQAKNF